MDDLLSDFSKIALIGLVSGFFSSFLSNKNYRYQKWWELRVESYKKVIEALSELRHCYMVLLKFEEKHMDIPSKLDESLTNQLEQAWFKLRTLIDMGTFIFSDKINAEFKILLQTDNSSSYVESLDSQFQKVDKCLQKVTKYSKYDLSLKFSWYKFFWNN